MAEIFIFPLTRRHGLAQRAAVAMYGKSEYDANRVWHRHCADILKKMQSERLPPEKLQKVCDDYARQVGVELRVLEYRAAGGPARA